MENRFLSKTEDFQIVQLLERYFRFWPWFVLSVVFCCALAVLYVKSVPRQYKRTATVIIKDDDNQDITAAFSTRDPFRTRTNVNNEVEAFKSSLLMQEVGRRLNLYINYTTKKGLRDYDLYSQSPIIATFPDSLELLSFSFKVEIKSDSMIVLSNFVQDKTKQKDSFNTQFNKVTKTPVGDIMISPSLYYSSDQKYNPIVVSKSDIESVALNLVRTVKISLMGKLNTVISLELEDVSIQRAEDVLNTLITVYQENWITQKNKGTNSTLSFLNERIPVIEQELMDIDGRVVLFKSRNLVTNVQNQASLQMSQSMEYSGRIQETRSQIEIARVIQEYLKDNTKISELLPTNTGGIDNPALESAISQYNTMLADRNRLVANSSELNPIIVERTRALQALRQTIIQTVDNLITSLDLQLSGLQSQEARVTRNIASNPSQERFLMSVEREQKTKENLYIYLLQQREENEMSLIVTATNLQIISPPIGSMNPVRPIKFQILMIALIIGCSIPFCIILVYELINVTIRDKKDLESLPVPLLGVIPEEKIENEKKILKVNNKKGALNESFRILRTNLRFSSSKDTKVIQITSLEPNAGKTFTALNLAVSFAVTGKKVALLDLDLRMAAMSKLSAEEKNKQGISDILSGQIRDINKIIQKDFLDKYLKENKYQENYFSDNTPDLHLIPVGEVPINPVELLMSDRLASEIELLKKSYDYIFIDSAPIHPVIDSMLVAQYVDISILVVRENYTDRRRLSDIKNMFDEGKFKNMHIILNGSTTEAKLNKYNAYYIGKDKNDKSIAELMKELYEKISNTFNLLIKKLNEVSKKIEQKAKQESTSKQLEDISGNNKIETKQEDKSESKQNPKLKQKQKGSHNKSKQ